MKIKKSNQSDNSIILAPSYHPLNNIDNFIFDCGWTHEKAGFVPPKSWQKLIAIHHGGGRHWRRKDAAMFCIIFHENDKLES